MMRLFERIRKLREAGAAVTDAVRRRCAQRFRPVLMAATVAMLGLAPFLIATRPGSEAQRRLAIVVIEGDYLNLADAGGAAGDISLVRRTTDASLRSAA